MDTIRKLSTRDKRTFKVAVSAFLVICIVVGFVCFLYYKRLQSTVKAETSGYMQEISMQMCTNVSDTINNNFSILGTIATVIQNMDIDSHAELQAVVAQQKNLWDYENIMPVDANGIAYDITGKSVALTGDTYLQDAIVGQKQSMSASQVIGGQERIAFAVPLKNSVIDGTEMRALVASYDLSTFDKILSLSAFSGKGYAHIIRDDGTVVVRSSSQKALQTGYNILTSLSSAEIKGDATIEVVRSDLLNGINGLVEFKSGDAHEYMTYTPLGTQGWSLLTFVPVEVVNAKSNILLQITLLLCAFITVLFCLLLATLMFTFFKNKRKLESIAYVDPITQGHTQSRFSEIANDILLPSHKPQYAMIYANIEKFKVLNEQFGKNACDEILKCISSGIGSCLDDDECLARMFADNFCILVKYEDESTLAQRFSDWERASAKAIESGGSTWHSLILEFGVFVIDNDTIALPNMIDRAKLSLTEATCELRGKIRYAIYDEKVRRALFREKKLEDMMERALANSEFQVFLQPKYDTQTEKIGGAEALVRWASGTDGMIYPDEFIPLFEKNGFVIQLDLYVFEVVCRTVRRWLDEGKSPVKISVNCSRMHLKSRDFLNKYTEISNRYDIPKMQIEIELTENTVFEDVDYLSNVIRDIHDAGFGCSMDDFGSGYSSLNLIQDIPVDTLKLDKIFFRTMSRDISRTESVVGSIINMSKALSMQTVAEGVEERPQVEMLKRLNCDYIQGYYFAKPMPISDFEKIAF